MSLLLILFESSAVAQIQCTFGNETSGFGTTANWPTYHFMNNVTRNATGALLMEPLNDANAIAEYKGIYHVMMQEGGGNWSHAVSNNMVQWYLVEDALDSGGENVRFPDVGPCDGSLSFPDLGEAPYNGSTPLIVYDAACGVPLIRSNVKRGEPHVGAGDDVDRLEVARPADPSDPYLRSWTKTLPGPIQFDGAPCAFPSKVWRSESAVTPAWNMLCNMHGNQPWSRFTSTTSTLMRWKLADQNFTIPPVGGYDFTAGGEMFEKIPNPLPGGNTHMITGRNLNGGRIQSVFYLGNYSATTKKMTLDMELGPQTIEWGFVHRWAVTSRISDGRLVHIGWLRRPDTEHVQCPTIPNSPENRFGGCEHSVASLVRELLLDHATGQLVSRPITEYTNLHTTTFIDRQLVPLLPVDGSAVTLPISEGQGGSLDVDVTFDLSPLGSGGSGGEFGVALRSPTDSLSAALTLAFNASAPDPDGTRLINIRCSSSGGEGNVPAPLPPLRVLQGERLSVRALIDRPYIEVFLQGGRIAFVVAPAFNATTTAVRLFNGYGGGRTELVANVTVHGMGCGWATDLPKPRGYT